MHGLRQPITNLAGVGAHTASRLAKLGLHTLYDLLLHIPLRYEDRTQISPIGSLQIGAECLIRGRIELADVLTKGRKSLICKVSDGTGVVDLRFFHFSFYQQQALKAGQFIQCYGEVRAGYMGPELVHPEYTIIPSLDIPVTETSLTPIYPLTEGINQHALRKLLKQTLLLCEKQPSLLADLLPVTLLNQFQLPTLAQALQTIHAPTELTDVKALQQDESPALKRLAFEELLAHHIMLKSVRQQAQLWSAPVLTATPSFIEKFLSRLAFTLTSAQQRVIAEIVNDLMIGRPMMRLVQGDVGSGKTIVAAYAALLALASGYQVAIMAPTELLAEQHYRNFSAWFVDFNLPVYLITGQLKGQNRQQVLAQLQTDTPLVVVGTHALFQDSVNFNRLGLIIIDEQHRFGVHQRLALREKGQQHRTRPHQLVMTATPIPRTLAMLQYSDLDISIIDELPPGRKPIVTVAMPSQRRDEVIARIQDWVQQKRQVYWVCTLIEESDALQAEAAENSAQRLTASLTNIRVGLVHGRMKNTEKTEVMSAFKNHHLDVLVATTVIEVGVDVPNASLMVIENPERLGLSQLHQLRGRVGRGSADSYCVLMYQSPLSEIARQRLGILRDSQDGFVIAEKDLQLRGPGDIMGIRQTGAMSFKIADLRRDAALLDRIPEASEQLFLHSPQSIQPLCERWLGALTDYSEV